MGYEIDFIGIDDENEKSADAIVFVGRRKMAHFPFEFMTAVQVNMVRHW